MSKEITTSIEEKNKAGEWVPAIPEPFYGLKKICSCGKSFWKYEKYREHYAYKHINQGE